VPNPVLELENNAVSLIKGLLARHGIYGVEVEPLVVFAETFDTPNLYLGRIQNAVVFKDIRTFMAPRRQPREPVKDVAGLKTLLEAHMDRQ
jgi:hypothetical protein